MSQVSIDYSPKSLYSELKKAVGTDVELKEMSLLPEIARTIHFGKFFSVNSPINHSIVKYVYIGRVNTCRAGGCAIKHVEDPEGESEFFDYFIFFDTTATVQLVKIHNYEASHGQEITSSNWLKQFKNYNGKEELIAGKNIDAISGATISVDATTFDIELRTNLLKKIIQQLANK
jgi:hypothetical protein